MAATVYEHAISAAGRQVLTLALTMGGLVYVTEIAKGEQCGRWDNPPTCPCAPVNAITDVDQFS